MCSRPFDLITGSSCHAFVLSRPEPLTTPCMLTMLVEELLTIFPLSFAFTPFFLLPRQLGDLAEAACARASGLRTSADESQAAVEREAEIIESATRQECRIRAEALAAKASQDAAVAVAQEKKLQRERDEAGSFHRRVDSQVIDHRT